MRITHFSFLIVIFFIFSFFSCADHVPSQALLDRAERFMYTHPDSALRILEQDIESHRLSSRQQADWCLLLTQAQDRNYKEHTTDSVIRIAVDYYLKHENPERLMMAYYYLACFYMDSGDVLQAQEYYLNALKSGERTDNISQKARICANLGHIYIHQDIQTEAIPYLQQAKDCFTQLNDSANLAIVLRNIARAYTLEEQLDSVKFYYLQALKYTNEIEKPFILNELSSHYYENKEIEKADYYNRKALQYADESERYASLFLVKAKLLREMGVRDSATYYFIKSLNSQKLFTLASAYKNLYSMAKEDKDWKNYMHYQTRYEDMREDLSNEMHVQDLYKIQSLYTYQVKESEVTALKLAKTTAQRNLYRLLLVTILLLMVTLGIIFYVIKRKKKIRKEREKYLCELKEKKFSLSLKQVEQNRAQIDNIKQNLRESKWDERGQVEINLLECTNQFIMHLLKEKDEAIVKLKNNPLYQNLHNGKISHITQEQWVEIRLLFNDIYPLLLPQIKDLHAKISPEDMEIIYLLKMSFTPVEISQLLSKTLSGIYMRQSRLARKLFGENATTDQLIDYLNGF